MFTKTIKKYMGLGLVLAFCSASSMAADQNKIFTAAQYQPISFAGIGGITVVGTTAPGCTTNNPPVISFTPVDVDASTSVPILLGETFMRSQIMDIITKAKVAGKSIDVYYSTDTGIGNGCNLTAVIMQ